MPLAISRRTFAGTLGAAAGAALFDSPLVRRTAEAATARRARPLDAVLLNSNENPYGPFAKALEAAAKAAPNRYPDGLEEEVRAAIAKHHAVAPGNILLGCGSSEILRMAGMAFHGPDRRGLGGRSTRSGGLRVLQALSG